MSKSKFVVLIVIALLIGLFFYFDIGQYLNLSFIKAQQAALNDFYQSNRILTMAIYFLAYVAVTSLSLPGATFVTLLGGALFGLMVGTILVSFASTLGATLAFLISRFLLRDTVQEKFADKLSAINNGIEKDGAFYLFTLRLVPLFPFFVINLVMGLTKLKTWTYMWVSQLGMLAGTIVFVNAGTQLAQIESTSGILSPKLIASFALLGIFPLIAKKLIDWLKARKVYKPYKKPQKFDRNMVVIGAGSAGLVTAYIAAAVKSKVTLIEKHRMGGDCLNTGCVPSKALIRSAKFASHVNRAMEFGFDKSTTSFSFNNIMQRIHEVIAKIEPHDSVERYTDLGVECLQGEAQIISPYEVKINDQILTTRSIVIATGARPFVPPIPGIENIDYLTSDTIWDLKEQPKRLIILGGGPIGCELAQSFARLGSEVSQVEMLPMIMSREDPEVSELVKQSLMSDGVNVMVNHKAKEFIIENGQKILLCEEVNSKQEVRIEFDHVLVAVGRSANTSSLGLDKLGIETNRNGTVKVNEYLQTIFPNVYACGDVAGPYQFTHTAAHQAWYCAVNALFSKFKKFKVDYSVVPWATFTEPEVARVGLNETEAKQKSIPYEVTVYGIDDLDRAIADSEAHGFVKVLTEPNKDKILGVTIVGEHGGDLIAEYVLAMKHGLGLNKILGTIHIYPTLAEANKFAAGNWKKAHAPEKVLQWVERYHGWQRG